MFGARFQWDKVFLWGIGIYAVMSLLWEGFVLYGFTEGLVPQVVSLVTLILVATLAGRSLHLGKSFDILPYSLLWTLITMALDKILVFPVAGWGMYADVNLWVGYTLLLAIPLLAPYLKERPEPIQIS